MPTPRALSAALCVAALAPSLASAQPAIASDRPGLGSGSVVVDAGLLQFELGGEFADADTDAARISLGQGLVRYGVVDGFELQAILGSFTVTTGEDDGTRGLQDVGLGAKLRLPSPAPRLTWSVAASVLFPTGADRFTADDVVPASFLLADLALTDRLAVTANVGASGWASDAGDQVIVVVTPSVSLDDDVGLYGGYAGYYNEFHWAEAGVTWRRGADLQLDVNGGVEIDGGGAWFVGVGAARRWRP